MIPGIDAHYPCCRAALFTFYLLLVLAYVIWKSSLMLSPRSASAPHYTRQKLFVLSLCLLLAAAPACAKAGGTEYFPLANGSKWEYAGRVSSPNGQFDVPASIHIEGETIIRGKHYFKYVIASDLSALNKSPRRSEEVRYYRVAQDGIYFLLSKDTGGNELLEMPLPIPTGVSWLTGTSEVRAERAGTIKVGEREYADCLKIIYKGAGGVRRTEYYLAPGMGIVRAVYADVVGLGSSLELTLEKYER
jgi:hypothetical protein